MIADDHRHDAIHVAGDLVVQTPNLNALAAGGVRFRRAHIMGGLTGAVCIPTRACLHTGANTLEAVTSQTIEDVQGLMTLRPELPLLGETLRQAGYRTFATGKWHNDKASFARSFEYGANIFFGGMSDHNRVPLHDFDPDGLYPNDKRYTGDGFSTELFSDAAIHFIERHDGEQPFFLYAAFTAPHDPRTPPGAFATMYDPDSIPLPPNFLPEHPFDNGEYHVRDEKLASWPRTAEDVRRHLADYYGMISHLDHHIDRVLAALRITGQYENTVIVYMADHGLAVGQHGLLGKQNLYDHSIRVPLILQGPGLPAGMVVESLAYSHDVFPTLCELANTPAPATVESQSLLPLVEGEAGRPYVCSIYKDLMRSVSDGRWKLIRYYRSPLRHEGTTRIQLFHLADDPWETHDLAQDPAQQVRIRQLAGALSAWMRQVRDPLAAVPVVEP
jgi:arylsulfatase A-like enzyme